MSAARLMDVSASGPTRLDWPPIIAEAARIVRSYDTPVTLRQLFYRLVAAAWIPNSEPSYLRLSDLTAKARRQRTFPPLVDLGRRVDRALTFPGPEDARAWLRDRYRRDRTEGQDWSIWLGVEKATLLGQLADWFDDLGLPRVALRGYASQTLADDVNADVSEDPRPAVLIYVGDYDPSGVHIPEDFARRAGCFDEVVRVAVNADQIAQYGLVPAPAKATDSRRRRTGVMVQVEAEALDPNDLRDLLTTAVARYWDDDAYQASLAREAAERDRL